MRLQRHIIWGIIIIVFLVGASWLGENVFRYYGEKAATMMQIKQGDQLIAQWTSDVLNSLPSQEKGNVDLKVLIEAAGINEYQQVIIQGRDDDDRLVVPAARVKNYRVVLLKNGTISLRQTGNSKNLVEKVVLINTR